MDQRIVLAVSGGPDSLALLRAAALYASAFAAARTFFHVVTIDHGLRAESPAEARFVSAVSARLGLSHLIRRWEGEKPSSNLSGAARQARYALLLEAARDLGASAIMTAHHQDDQIETHLLARARQAGDRGLAGMRPVRELAPGIALLRPFLDVVGTTLKPLAAPLDPIDDPSNRDSRFDRVCLRQRLAEGEIDRAAILGAIDGHRCRRDRADAALARFLVDLLAEDRLAVDAAGTLRLDAAVFVDPPATVAAELLARILPAVGGADYPPLRAATERLRSRLQAPAAGDAQPVCTLGGVSIGAGDPMVFRREFGRAGPASTPLPTGARNAIFDGRFDLAWEPLPFPTAIVPFGRLGRGNPTERCLPVLVDADGAPLAAHPALLPKFGAAVLRLATAERVSWRLLADLPVSRDQANRGILSPRDPSR